MRHFAPAQKFLAFLMDDVLGPSFNDVAVFRVGRQKNKPGAVIARGRQGDVFFGYFLAQKSIGHLDHDAGAITGFGITAAGPAMGQIFQDLDAGTDNIMGLAALDINNKTDPAAVVLILRIVESLFWR